MVLNYILASVMTLPSSPGKVWLNGGAVLGRIHFQTPSVFISLAIAEGAMAAGYGSGNTMSDSWQMKPRWKSMFPTSQREPPNGIRLNINCFAIFQKTGRDSHLLMWKP